MIIQGSKTLSYCTDCDRTPVAAYGNICATCRSIREVQERWEPVYIKKYVAGALIFLVAVLSFMVIRH